jgi:sulfur-oxidizing protein SoxA
LKHLVLILKPAFLVFLCGFALAQAPEAGRRSGYDDMSRETRAMQDDEMSNPGTLWVLDGEALWKKPAGASGKSCAGCHGDAPASMKGVAVRYPAFDAGLGRPLNLWQRINACHTERQQAAPLAFESRELLALGAYVGVQSRGMPIAPVVDEKTRPFIEAGREIFQRRQGQLNISCAQCHDQYAGRKLAGNLLPQGHPTGYPLYRLEWQNLGSLERRLRNCMVGVRAEPYEAGSEQFVALEMFLMWRARGMKLETPAVRP